MKKNIFGSHRARIQYLLQRANLTPEELAFEIGLLRPVQISQILRGENPVSPFLALLIHHRYPAYSIRWLLTGEGAFPEAPDREPLPITASIVGRWEITGACDFEENLCRWKKFLPFSDRHEREFSRDGWCTIFQDDEAVRRMPYTLYPDSQQLAIGGCVSLVTRLDALILDVIDWSDWWVGGLVKFSSRRIR